MLTCSSILSDIRGMLSVSGEQGMDSPDLPPIRSAKSAMLSNVVSLFVLLWLELQRMRSRMWFNSLSTEACWQLRSGSRLRNSRALYSAHFILLCNGTCSLLRWVPGRHLSMISQASASSFFVALMIPSRRSSSMGWCWSRAKFLSRAVTRRWRSRSHRCTSSRLWRISLGAWSESWVKLATRWLKTGT